MAQYEITAPDGHVYTINAPDNATEAEVLAYAQQNYQNAGPDTQVKAPTAEEYQNHINSMIQNQSPRSDIEAYVKSVNGVISPEFETALTQYDNLQKQGRKPVFMVNSTTNPDQSLSTEAPLKPVIDQGDGATGAFIRGAGDTASFGLLDEAGAVVDNLGLTPGRENIWNSDKSFGDLYNQNVEQNRAILRGDEQNHGTARFLGQVAGAAIPGTGGAGVAGRSLSAGRNLLRAAGEGAAYGLGSAEGGVGDRVTGAAEGAVIGASGDRFIRGLGRVISPKVSPTIERLMENGVKPSPGQYLPGSVGTRLESMFGKVPGVGAGAKKAQEEAVDSIERGAYNEAVKAGTGQSIPKAVSNKHLDEYATNAIANATQNPNMDDLLVVKTAKAIADQEGTKINPEALKKASQGVSAARQSGLNVSEPKDVLDVIDSYSRQGIDLPEPAALGQYVDDVGKKFSPNMFAEQSTQDQVMGGLGAAGTAAGAYALGHAIPGGSAASALYGLYTKPGRQFIDNLATGRQSPAWKVGRSAADRVASVLPRVIVPDDKNNENVVP